MMATTKEKRGTDCHLELTAPMASMERDEELHALLVSYTETSRHTLRSCPLFLSLGTDKSVVKSYSLQSTVAVLPTNQAFWLTPQVLSGIPWL